MGTWIDSYEPLASQPRPRIVQLFIRPFVIPNIFVNSSDEREARREVVPPERVELSSPAPEAGTLSTELQGQPKPKNSMVAFGSTT